MSLILDALARAERDRQRGESPSLGALLETDAPAERPRLAPWIIVLACFLGLLALLWWFFADDNQGSSPQIVRSVEPSPATSVVTEASTQGLRTLPESNRASQPQRQALGSQVESEPPASVDISSNTAGASRPVFERALPDDLAADIESSFAELDDDARAEIEALYRQETQSAVAESEHNGAVYDAGSFVPSNTAATLEEAIANSPGTANSADSTTETSSAGDPTTCLDPGATIDEAVDLAAILREVQAEQAARAAGGLIDHPAPLLDTLTKQFRDRVPTLMYARHDHNPGAASSVVLNGSALREGQRTRGVKVREILSDSVILRFEGTDFRLRALNSWVNL